MTDDTISPEVQAMAAQYEKKIYDLQQLLKISLSLNSTIEFSTLIESFLYACMCQMHVMGACLFTLDPINKNVFSMDNNYRGIELDPDMNYSISVDNRFIQVINKQEAVFQIEDLEKEDINKDIVDMIKSLNPSLIIPLFEKNHINGILFLGERIDLGDGLEYNSSEIEQILVLASLSAVAINNATLVERSSTDMMTHLKLKFYFNQILAENLDRSISQNVPLSVIMFDIDLFKKCNDTYGHACGDYILTNVAKIIKSSIRSQDLAGRFGGEEFTVMLKNTPGNIAMQIAERIRKTIEDTVFHFEGNTIRITISGGVTVFDSVDNFVTLPETLVEQADKALYVSKNSGRNKITLATKEILTSVKESE